MAAGTIILLIVLSASNIVLLFMLVVQRRAHKKFVDEMIVQYKSANINFRKMEGILDDARNRRGKIK